MFDKNLEQLQTALLAVVAGAVVTPFNVSFGLIMSLFGIIGVSNYYMNWSKFNRLWINLNLCKGEVTPILKEINENEISTVYRFTLPTGLSLDDFEKHQLAIEQFLDKQIKITYNNKNVFIEAFNNKLSKLIPYEFIFCKSPVSFVGGIDRYNKNLIIDLSENEPHMIVCGETGSGKSVFLRGIITSLILKNSVDLYLIDYKMGAEFRVFERCKNVIKFAKTIEQGNKILNELSNEVDYRYTLFAKNNCVDIKEYNRLHTPLRYKVLIIDEFAEMASEKNGIERIQSLTAKARAAGIHCILSTQRPSADVINGRIKANCATIIGLKTMNALNSRVVLDHDGLEELRGNGHAIIRHNGEETEVQCMYLSVEQARELVKHTYINKQKKMEITDLSFLSSL